MRFNRNVFDKIEYFEKSPSPRHGSPWRLLRSMLSSRDSPDFRISVQKWLNRSLLNAKTLSKIETHLDTSNATEAWILLAIVAPNIQGHNPERISKLLLTNLKYDMVSNGNRCEEWQMGWLNSLSIYHYSRQTRRKIATFNWRFFHFGWSISTTRRRLKYSASWVKHWRAAVCGHVISTAYSVYATNWAWNRARVTESTSLRRCEAHANHTFLPTKIRCSYKIYAMIVSSATYISTRKLLVCCNRNFIPKLWTFSSCFCTRSATNINWQVSSNICIKKCGFAIVSNS